MARGSGKIVGVTNRYGYANQVLSESGVQIFSGKQRILEHRHKFSYDVKKPETKIYTSDEALSSELDPMILSYNQLLNYGFKISAKYGQYIREGQKINKVYALVKINSYVKDYGMIPPGHQIILDRNDFKIRLEGPNIPSFIGPWHQVRDYYLTRDYLPSPERTFLKDVYERSERELSILSGELHSIKEVVRVIEEIPVLTTSNNDLICLPKTVDPITAAIVGKRGEGKSLLLQRICTLCYYRWGTRNIIFNDITGETAGWSKPWQKGTTFSRNAINELALIGEHTVPYPIVYLHPEKNPQIKKKEMVHPDESGIKISLPFEEFIRDFDAIMSGDDIWNLGKSGRYFRNAVKKMPEKLTATSYDEFKTKMKLALAGMNDEEQGVEVPEGVQPKILSILEDMYNANILNVATGIPSEWRAKTDLEEWENYPWLVLMKYGITPAILTKYIRDFRWFPQYMRFINKSIMNAQDQDPLFKGGVVMQFIDEITGIANKDKPTVANETLELSFAEGRNLRIGGVYATQSYEKVPDRIRTNTHYAFIFRQAGTGLNALKDDFEELKGRSVMGWSSEISRLRKFECVAVTDEYFVKYKINGEREESTGPFKGTIIPPVSNHLHPGEHL